MKRFVVTALVCGAALAAGASPAGATNECRGLMVCVPVAGPWVVVPAASRRVEFQLQCPRGYVVGGLDAELSDRAVEVTFLGLTGSPVNPGITTQREAQFLGVYAGRARAATTFRPHIGCIPAAGGGGGAPPNVRRLVFPPGRPVVRRVRNVRVRGNAKQRALHACAPGERLLSASHAVAFYTRRPPVPALVGGVTVSRSVRTGRVRATIGATDAIFGTRTIVQLQALCAGVNR